MGEKGSLTAHAVQHVLLGDLAAPFLLLGLPPGARRAVSRTLERAAQRDTSAARALTGEVSPLGALISWAVATYVWLFPPLHRLAVPDGLVHALDHVSFLAFGLLIWLGAFARVRRATGKGGASPRRPSLVGTAYLRHVHQAGDAPARDRDLARKRHRLHPAGASPPGGISLAGDRERAASVMIGFEMLLAVLAVVLAFVFVSVYEGRQRETAQR